MRPFLWFRMTRWMAYRILVKNSSPTKVIAATAILRMTIMFRKPRHLKAAGEGKTSQMRKKKKKEALLIENEKKMLVPRELKQIRTKRRRPTTMAMQRIREKHVVVGRKNLRCSGRKSWTIYVQSSRENVPCVGLLSDLQTST